MDFFISRAAKLFFAAIAADPRLSSADREFIRGKQILICVEAQKALAALKNPCRVRCSYERLSGGEAGFEFIEFDTHPRREIVTLDLREVCEQRVLRTMKLNSRSTESAMQTLLAALNKILMNIVDYREVALDGVLIRSAL